MDNNRKKAKAGKQGKKPSRKRYALAPTEASCNGNSFETPAVHPDRGPSPEPSPHDAPYAPIPGPGKKRRVFMNKFPKMPNLSDYKDSKEKDSDRVSVSPATIVPEELENNELDGEPGVKSIRDRKPPPKSAPAKLTTGVSTSKPLTLAKLPTNRSKASGFKRASPPATSKGVANPKEQPKQNTLQRRAVNCTPFDIEMKKQYALVRQFLTRSQGGRPSTTQEVRMFIKHQARLDAHLDESQEVQDTRIKLFNRSGILPSRRDINAYLIEKEKDDKTPNNSDLTEHHEEKMPAEENEIPDSAEAAAAKPRKVSKVAKAKASVASAADDEIESDGTSDSSFIEYAGVVKNAPCDNRKRKVKQPRLQIAIRKVKTTTSTTTNTRNETVKEETAMVPAACKFTADDVLTAVDVFPTIEKYIDQAGSMAQRTNRIGALMSLGSRLIIGCEPDSFTQADSDEVQDEFEKLCARLKQENYQLWVIERSFVCHQKLAVTLRYDFKDRAIRYYHIGPYDYGLIDWWAYDGFCLPAINELFKIEHTAEGKQSDILEKILFHPIRCMEKSNKFVKAFQQGGKKEPNYKEFEIRFMHHCSIIDGRGSRSWPVFLSEKERICYMSRYAQDERIAEDERLAELEEKNEEEDNSEED